MRFALLPLVLVSMIASPLAYAAPSNTKVAPFPRINIIDYSQRLAANQMNAVVTNQGSFGYDILTGNSGLEYPTLSGRTALFAGGLWLGGITPGDTSVTVAEYSFEYTPGVWLTGGFDQSANPEFRVFPVGAWRGAAADTVGWADYLANAAPFGAPTRTWRIPDDGTPDPSDSVDVIGPDVTGTRMTWCIYHDGVESRHNNSAGNSLPLDVEVQQTFAEFAIPGSLDHAVILHYRIINQGVRSFSNFIASMWSDPDLGGFTDDLVGYAAASHTGYVYNSTNADEQYGNNPPALGFRLLSLSRNRQSLAVDWFAFNKYINGTDPDHPRESFRAMSGLQSDGSPMIDPITSLPSTYFATGDPTTGTGWLDTAPADRRMIGSAPPVAFLPGDTLELDVAMVGGFGGNRLASITAMLCHSDSVQALFASGRIALLSQSGGSGVPSIGACGAPPEPLPNCPRSLAYWRDQCAGLDPQYTLQNLDLLAHAVDSLTSVFDWDDPNERALMCAALTNTGTARDSAKAEYVAFLCNYLAAGLGIQPATGAPVVLDPMFQFFCSPFTATSIRELTFPYGSLATLASADYVDHVTTNAPALVSPFGPSFLPQGVRFGDAHFGSTLSHTLEPDSFPDVEIRFDATQPQKAYRYLRPERQSDAGPPGGGGFRYLYAGHVDVAFSVWNTQSGQQLEVAYSERVLTDDDGTILAPAFQPATFDSTWSPDTSSLGGREVLWILSTAYQFTPRAEYALDDLLQNGSVPSLYNVEARRDVAGAIIDDGDAFVIRTQIMPGSSAEDFLVRFESGDLGDTTIARLYVQATECLGAVNRGDVFTVVCDETTPVLASLVESLVLFDRVELRWLLGGTSVFSARLERRDAGGAWNDMGALEIANSGFVVAIDTSVEPGARYDYRLALNSREGLTYAGETEVRVPARTALLLFGPRPHPAQSNRLTVWFALPARGSARLEVLDLAGRLVARRDSGPLEPGLHAIDMSNARLAPGVYAIRLTQGGDTVSRKAVIMQ